MIERSEVRADTPLATLLPVTGALADVTLSQLATHTSGLPTQLPTLSQAGRNYWASLTAGNPYGGSVQQRLDALGDVQLDAAPGTYSNLGFELLGAALAAAADRPYRDLLRERILTPVGLTRATVPYADAELTDADLLGQTAGGRTADAWLGEALAPAGGVRADIGEMASLTQRLLTGRAPGLDALKPKVTADDTPTGWAWITQPSPFNERTVTWHNGGTGGFTSFLGIDPERQTGVVILSARAGADRTPPPGPVSSCWTGSGTAHDHRRRAVAPRRRRRRRVRRAGLVAGTPGGQGAGVSCCARGGCGRRPGSGPRPGAAARDSGSGSGWRPPSRWGSERPG